MKKKKVPRLVQAIRDTVKPRIDYRVQKTFSYSQLSTYLTCNHRWYLDKVEKRQVYEPSIHTVFGTSLHETVQEWLDVMYTTTFKKGSDMDLSHLLLNKMKKIYGEERQKVGSDFSSSDQLRLFHSQGVKILEFLKKRRADYFYKNKVYLAGIETPVVYEVRPNILFVGYIDLVFYNETLDKILLIDIKTSTRGWSPQDKKDQIKQSQLVLYKYFFSKLYNIPLDNIDVQFFICKREVFEEGDWPSKRVQIFTPNSGKIKVKRVVNAMEEFINNVFDENTEYKHVQHSKSPSKQNCRFCPYLHQLHLCDEGIK